MNIFYALTNSLCINLIDAILPKKYSKNIAPDNNNCVTGSADGVNTAPKIVEKSIIGRQ